MKIHGNNVCHWDSYLCNTSTVLEKSKGLHSTSPLLWENNDNHEVNYISEIQQCQIVYGIVDIIS